MALPSLHHFSTPITLKLTNDFLFIWKQQIFATLHGLDLMHLLDGTNVPSKFLPFEDQYHETTINPVFLHYYKQAQLLVAWLLASISSSILTKMVGLEFFLFYLDVPIHILCVPHKGHHQEASSSSSHTQE